MEEYPPDYIILAAVHLKPKSKKPSEAEFHAQIPELQSMLGTSAQPIPAELRSMLAWAEEQHKLMKK